MSNTTYYFHSSGKCEEPPFTPDDSISLKDKEDELENSDPKLKTADKEGKSTVGAGKKC